MSLRKFMHPRNKYKEEPNYKKLAILYPEFRKVVFTDISGKVKLNYKDKEALRVLTKILLKHDFNLEVDIPTNKLIPALPLRLNYILWVEDLLKHSGTDDLSTTYGIDIGTGAISIYPLLISRTFKSKMIGTDIDAETINSAERIIQNNNLQDIIKVALVNKESFLKEVVHENNISFVMCNPPFFETKDYQKVTKRQPPRNAPTGNETEIIVKGGETEFILRLIQESLEYKNKIQLYTTMLGQRSSLGFLIRALVKNNIVNMTWTEFCQGFTKRWGIAWTFADKNDIDLTTAPVIRTRNEVTKLKKNKFKDIICPSTKELNSLDAIVAKFKQWFIELNIETKEIELVTDYPSWTCQLKCYCDTWTHARRKRRMNIQQEAFKKQCIKNPDSEMEKLEFNKSLPMQHEDICNKLTVPLLVCTLIIAEHNDNNEETSEDNNKKIFKICMIFDAGHGGKLSFENLRQYFHNKLQNPLSVCKKEKGE